MLTKYIFLVRIYEISSKVLTNIIQDYKIVVRCS